MANAYEYLVGSGAFVGCPGDVNTFAQRLREVWEGIPVSGIKPDIYYWHKHYDPFAHTASIGGQYGIQRTSHPSVNPVFILFGHSIGTPVRPPHEGWDDLRSWLNSSGWGVISLLGEPDFQEPAYPPTNKIPLSGTMFELFDAIKTGSDTDLIIYDLSRVVPSPITDTPEHAQQRTWCEWLLRELGKNYTIRRPETEKSFEEHSRADLKTAFHLPFRNPLFGELPGLSAEGADDSLLFARGDLIKTLSGRILDEGATFTRVLGVSGAGKSSLLRAGLMGTWFLKRRGIDANRTKAIALLVEPDSLRALESDPLLALGKLLTDAYAGRNTGAVGPRTAGLVGPVPELRPPTDHRVQDLKSARTWWAELTCAHAGPIILILDQAEQIDAQAKRQARSMVERDSSIAYAPALSLHWRRFVDLLLNLSGAGEVKLDCEPPRGSSELRLVLGLHRESAIDLWGCDPNTIMRNRAIEVPALMTQDDWQNLITQTLAAYEMTLDRALLDGMVAEAIRLVNERQIVHADDPESLDIRYEQASILPLVKAALQLVLTEWRRRMLDQGKSNPTKTDLHLDRQTYVPFASIAGAVDVLGNRALGQWYGRLRSGIPSVGLFEEENLARELARRFDHLFTGLIDVGDKAKPELSQISRSGEIALSESDLIEALRAQRLLTGPDAEHWRLPHRTVIEFWKFGTSFCKRYADRQAIKRRLRSYRGLNQAAAKWEDDDLDSLAELAFGWIGNKEGDDASLRQYLREGLTQRFRPEMFTLKSSDHLSRLPLLVLEASEGAWGRELLQRALNHPSWPERAGLWVILLAKVGHYDLLQLAVVSVSPDFLGLVANYTERSTGTFPLLLAAENGHKECVRLLLQHGAEVNRVYEKTGTSSLFMAAQNGHAECVWLLLEHGAKAKQADETTGTSPLFMAAQCGHADCVRLLLEHGAEANGADGTTGLFPLLISAQNGHAECVRLLLEHGAEVNRADETDGGFPLLISAQNGHVECVRFLLEHGADTDQIDKKGGMFPPSIAAQEGHAECVRLLLEYGAEANRANRMNGTFPLLMAAQSGRKECVLLLLEHGAEANQIDEQHGTFPLLLAAQNGHVECVQLLLEHSAEANRAIEQHGTFPLLLAALNGHAECVRLLLEHGAEANRADKTDGLFPLLISAQNGHAECVRLLLEHGAEANRADDTDGLFPLSIATQYGHAECVRLLLQHGADPNQANQRDGTFPLLLAAQTGHERCVCLLLEHGAETNRINEQHGTFPLLMAAQEGRGESLRLLLQHGAEANQANERNSTFPLLRAAQNGHSECLRLLLEHGSEAKRANEKDGTSSLLLAAQNGHSECVRLLLEHGAEVDRANEKTGTFPLLLAAEHGHAECVRSLLEHGAKANRANKKNGTFPLLMAAQNGHGKCVRLLLEHGAAANRANEMNGASPLLIAAQDGHAECVRSLLEHHAEANHANEKNGTFPLLMASQNGHAECVLLLLERGAETNRANEKTAVFPLLLAAETGHAECVRLLLEHGAETNRARERNGTFPLLMAAENGHVECVRLLLEHGSEANRTNERNGTFPLLMAAQNGHAECVRTLLEHGADASQADGTDGATPFRAALASRRWKVVRLLAAQSEALTALSDAGRALVEAVNVSTDEQLGVRAGVRTSQNPIPKSDEVGVKDQDSVPIPIYLNSSKEVSAQQKRMALENCLRRYGIHPSEIEASNVEAVSQPLNEHGDSLIRLDLNLKPAKMHLQVLLILVQTSFTSRYEVCEPGYDLNGLALSMSNLGRRFRLVLDDAALSWASLWLILKGATPVLPHAPWPLFPTAKLPSTGYPEEYWRPWRFAQEASGPIATVPFVHKDSLLLGKVLVPEDGVGTQLVAEPEKIMTGLALHVPRFIASQKDGPPTGLWYVRRWNA